MLTDFDEIREAYRNETTIALDLETTGLSPWNDNIAVIAMFGPESQTPSLLHYPRGTKVPDAVFRWLETFDLIITHNGTQFDILFLACAGMDWTKVRWYDTLIGEQAVIAVGRRDVRVNLQDTVKRRLGKVLNKDIDHRTWQNEYLTQEQLDYVSGDIVHLYQLREAQLEKAAADTSGNMMRGLEFEQSLVPAVVAMELNGLPINVAKLETYVEASVDVKGTEQDWLWDRWEQEVKLTSPKALKIFLNERYPGMFPDTQAARLMEYTRMGGQLGEEMQHLLNFRHADQRRKMFSQSWIDQYVVYHADGIPRLHGKFWQIGTDTGRFCLLGTTEVQIPTDRERYPNGKPISAIKAGDWVYSFTEDRELCLRQVKWVGITGTKPTVTVTARNEAFDHTTSVTLTPDHLVRLRDGSWREAGQLKAGDRLLCGPLFEVDESGYYAFKGTGQRPSTRPTRHEHRWVYQQIHGPADGVVHHVDHNPLNNDPSNLAAMTIGEHKRLHARLPDDMVIEEFEAKGQLSSKRRSVRRNAARLGLYTPRGPRTKESVQAMLTGEMPITISLDLLRKYAHKFNLVPPGYRVRDGRLVKSGKGPGPQPTNHTVISVEPAGMHEVWDLEVEDTHTFIGNGIALHNSSSQPNLQQMPRDSRDIFGPMKGTDLVIGSSDYAAIEVRVAAALSGDRAMIDAFNAGEDIHTLVASESFDVPKESVTYEQRRIAKAISFTFLFGGGFETFLAYASSNGSTIDRDMGKEAMDRFFDRFHGIAEMRRTADYRCSTGRPMPIIYPTGLKRMLVGAELRSSVLLNNVVQGTAAAGLKMGLKRILEAGYADYLCAVVHDEVVYAAPASEIEKVREIVDDCMIEGMFDALAECEPVAIAVESSIGDSWAGDPSTERLMSRPPR